MPITRYVDTASTAGGDGTTAATSGANRAYATLNAALAEWAGVTLTDVVEIICAASTGVADTTPANATAKITSSATNFVLLRAATGHEALLSGWSTSRYRLDPGNFSALNAANIPHIRVQQLQIRSSPVSTSAGRSAINYGNPTDAGAFLEISSARVEVAANGTGTGHFGVNFAGASEVLRIVNTLVVVSGSNAANVVAINCATATPATTSALYNLTVIGGSVGIQYNGATGGSALKVVNCLTADCTDGFSTSTFRTGTDYNASSVASDAPGTNSRSAQTFTFENAGSGDYRLSASDAGARGFGANLSADSDYAFTVDMAGTTRTVPWDIGAHQVSVTASTTARPKINSALISPLLTGGLIR